MQSALLPSSAVVAGRPARRRDVWVRGEEQPGMASHETLGTRWGVSGSLPGRSSFPGIGSESDLNGARWSARRLTEASAFSDSCADQGMRTLLNELKRLLRSLMANEIPPAHAAISIQICHACHGLSGRSRPNAAGV